MADGYLPSPLVLATAMAARTTTLPIMTAALILPLYDPIRLAEDMVVLDIISGGRVSYVMAVGYRPEEFEHHGADFGHRGPARRGPARAAAAGQDRRAVRARGPAHPRHPAAGHPRWADGDVGRRQPRRGQAGRPLRPRLLRAGRGSGARGGLRGRGPAHGREPGVLHDPADRHGDHGRSSPTTSTPPGPSSARTSSTTSASYAAINEGNTHTASLSTGHDGGRAARRGPQPPHRHRRRGRRDDQGGHAARSSNPSSAACRPRSPGATSAPSPTRSCPSSDPPRSGVVG